MATLYRKYRPQNFQEAVNQNHIKTTLQNEIQTGQIAHAYLFCGPRAVGKTTLARVFSKAINCQERKSNDYEPCNKCDFCQEITQGKSLDIIEIDAASHTGVDNVRENVISASRITPTNLNYKVFIIDEVHMLSISAFNALLKVIEEPPESVIFILCTTEVHKVPTTIISRCQRFDFKRIGVEDIVKKLRYITDQEGIKVDKNILEDIARQSEGHMRDAESLLGQIVAISGKEIKQEEAELVIPRSDLNEIINLITAIQKKDISGGISLVNKLIDDGVDLRKFLDDFIEILRKMMLTKVNPQLGDKLGLEVGESLEIKINDLNKNLELVQLVAFIDKFLEVRNKIKNSFIVQLPVELAITELCSSDIQVKKNSKPLNPEQNSNVAPQKPNPTPKTATEKSNNDSAISKEEIGQKWHEVLAKIKKYNHSLSFILKVCQPRKLEGNQLCLAFKYKFHKDRIEEAKIKEMISQVLKEVYNKDLYVEAVIDENLEVKEQLNETAEKEESDSNPEETKSNENGNEAINNLLKNFGGRIVK